MLGYSTGKYSIQNNLGVPKSSNYGDGGKAAIIITGTPFHQYLYLNL
jgi:hypothetical protein